MNISRFKITLSCACGKTTQMEVMIARSGGLVPLSCPCGRKFAMQQLDPNEVTTIEVDPTGITGGLVDQDLPKIH